MIRALSGGGGGRLPSSTSLELRIKNSFVLLNMLQYPVHILASVGNAFAAKVALEEVYKVMLPVASAKVLFPLYAVPPLAAASLIFTNVYSISGKLAFNCCTVNSCGFTIFPVANAEAGRDE